MVNSPLIRLAICWGWWHWEGTLRFQLFLGSFFLRWLQDDAKSVGQWKLDYRIGVRIIQLDLFLCFYPGTFGKWFNWANVFKWTHHLVLVVNHIEAPSTEATFDANDWIKINPWSKGDGEYGSSMRSRWCNSHVMVKGSMAIASPWAQPRLMGVAIAIDPF